MGAKMPDGGFHKLAMGLDKFSFFFRLCLVVEGVEGGVHFHLRSALAVVPQLDGTVRPSYDARKAITVNLRIVEKIQGHFYFKKD